MATVLAKLNARSFASDVYARYVDEVHCRLAVCLLIPKPVPLSASAPRSVLDKRVCLPSMKLCCIL